MAVSRVFGPSLGAITSRSNFAKKLDLQPASKKQGYLPSSLLTLQFPRNGSHTTLPGLSLLAIYLHQELGLQLVSILGTHGVLVRRRILSVEGSFKMALRYEVGA